ncbi:hypothetical protein C8034_v006897 [Colletotrichum sidae]|uniref:Uncharacterized protein n=1 Tax=Colletotrichum sidae TaxID=1347389 RepID=A0A4R8T9W2_9PEZI|nr:hypothetical protein C8034_v006897 [Colletotrichum sidae]
MHSSPSPEQTTARTPTTACRPDYEINIVTQSPRPRSEAAVTTQTVNGLLLRTLALLQTALSAATLHRALGFADRALQIASQNRRFDLEPRAHLYRGHVLRAAGRWRAAHAAYVRAASVRGVGYVGTNISQLTLECLEMMQFADDMKMKDEAEEAREAKETEAKDTKRAKEAKDMKKAMETKSTSKRKERGPRMVRFSAIEERTVSPPCIDENRRPGHRAGGMYFLLDESGEVVSSRDSLPDLRSARGRRSINTSPTV